MSTLAERLKENISPISNNDQHWVRFVKDHRIQILNSVTKINISPEKMHFNQYRMSSLLNSLNYNPDMAWIVMWLNQLDGNRDLTNVTSLKIPKYDVIKSLRDKYEAESD